MREVQALVSPSSKKHQDEDMEKRISKKKKTRKRQLVIPNQSSEEEAMHESPEPIPTIEPSSHVKTVIKPSNVSSAKSLHEEVRTLDIPTNVSNTDVNVSMGEGYLNQKAPKSTQGTIVILPIENVTTPLVSLPPYIIPIPFVTSPPTFT